ncbi:hypothetical protein TEA_028899 [Camellia sinensis var. sinensis]|uniref:Uncharacterized protein n=1 Tax=Camellia sinensis var. sinensis TaxID=542762 RepID=A0A4S4DQJ8_CAMSN|nr:hypothetical protein TEA_028899 [Camellia sinensis var. sinensis]
MLGNALTWRAGRGSGLACWATLWHGMRAVAWHSGLGMQANAVAWHAGRGRGMACWPRLRNGTPGNAVAWHARQRREKACGPRPWHGMRAKAVAWHAGRGRAVAFRPWQAGQRRGKACWATLWHGMRAVAWHSGLGMQANAVAWHAGRGRGMACWPRLRAGQCRGMACWATPWLGMRAEAVAWRAGRGRGMACWSRQWHDVLAKSVAWHDGQRFDMACWPRQWPGMLGKAVAWHAGHCQGMACWRRPWRGMHAKAVAWHVGQHFCVECWLRQWPGMLAKLVAWHASECQGMACWQSPWHGLLAKAAAVAQLVLQCQQSPWATLNFVSPRISESTVRCPGKAPRGAVPSPFPGRHAATRSCRGSSSSSPSTTDGFETGTPVPSPQNQSFSRSYGSILPTSLAYIVPSTRGCSPWRPDAVMSTTGRGRHSVLRIFKGCRGRTGHHAMCGALPVAGPYLQLSRFQGGQAIRTNGRSTWAGAEGFAATVAPSYSSGPGVCPDGRVSTQLGTVTRLPVHPASPVLLTKNGPLGALDSVARLNGAPAPSYLFKNSRPGSSYPEGNFGGNQLLDGSISLSPLYPSQTNDLHVSIAASLHQSFLWLCPAQAYFTIFWVPTGVLALEPFSEDQDSFVRVSRRPEWGARRPAPGARRCRSMPEGTRCQPRSGRRHLRGLFDCPGFGLRPDLHRFPRVISPDLGSRSERLGGGAIESRQASRDGPDVREATQRFVNHHLSRLRAGSRRGPTSAHSPSSSPSGEGARAMQRETPRQTCPQPNGFGRNLRSKTRWFTGFCSSHQVSHFTTFFIDARAEISVVESGLVFLRDAARERALFVRVPRRDSRRGLLFSWEMAPAAPGGAPGELPTGRGSRREGADGQPPLLPQRGSVDFSQHRRQRTAHVAAIRTLHQTIQSVGAMGGVYKGQGRSQRELMTCAY